MVQLGFSQIAGYMGKHLVIGYSLNFSPALISPTVFRTTANTISGYVPDISDGVSFNGVNTTHVLNLDYVHHRRKAVCLLVQYARTGLNYFSGNSYKYEGSYAEPVILNSLGIGFGIKLFKRENLAPYGPYVKWEGVMLLNRINYENTKYSRYDAATDKDIPTKPGSGVIDFQTFAIGFSWGRQRIIKDKFVFDRGIRFLVLPAASNRLNAKDYAPLSSRFESDGIERIFRQQLINFHIGIGFLAF